MSLYKFDNNDVFHNTIKVYPQNEFLIYEKKIYRNQKVPISGAYADPVGHAPSGYTSLYELNVDRHPNSLIYPFVTKQGNLVSFKSSAASSFRSDFEYGDAIVGTYPMSASLSVDRLPGSHKRITALKNTLNHYSPLSPHYSFVNTNIAPVRDLSEVSIVNLISIPSIFYGSSIKKGSVNLGILYNRYVDGRIER